MPERASMDDRTIAHWRLHAQRLAWQTFASVPGAVDEMLGVQAENYAQASWALATRVPGTTPHELGRLFNEGALLRTHVLRPTWHFVRPDDIRWLLEMTGERVMRSVRAVAKDIGVTDEHLERSLEVIADALAGGRPMTRHELRAILTDAGLPTQGQQLGTHLLHAEQKALICSGPIVDGEHTYALLADRAPNARTLEPDEAIAELVLRYFTGHGPATERDLSYWASRNLTDIRAGLAAVGDRLGHFEHDGKTYWFGQDPPEARRPVPRAHILQVLDEYHNGYQDTRHALDAEGIIPRDRRLKIGMVLVDGQMIGDMKRVLTSSAVRFEIGLFRTLTGDEHDAIAGAAGRYGAYLGLEPSIAYREA